MLGRAKDCLDVRGVRYGCEVEEWPCFYEHGLGVAMFFARNRNQKLMVYKAVSKITYSVSITNFFGLHASGKRWQRKGIV